MEIISAYAAIIAVAFALLSTLAISSRLPPPSCHGRFLTIDGLRGYLAFFVFLHHSCIWYYYLQTGAWVAPPFRLFVHFGQVGVSLFFMITGFLFFSKIMDDRGRGIDWLRLYVSRFLRLTPLYFFSMILLFSIVGWVTKENQTYSFSELIGACLKWLGFTIYFGAPDINGFPSTYVVNAGVTWTLPYEWTFYMALPIIALAIGVWPPVRYILLSVLLMYVFGYLYLAGSFYWLFLGGMVAAILVRLESFRAVSVSRWATLVVLFLVAYVVTMYPSVYDYVQAKFILVIVFCFIAGGNSIFGLLNSKVSRVMGEMAYSIYLLHGLVLFVAFRLVIGASLGKELSPSQYWGVILTLTPVLILICGLAFRFIEKPAMKMTGPLTDWIRAKKTNVLAGLRFR
ncbi:Acetyltransferase [Pseudomonas chlororaphis subsp. aurantiaca]|uniref:acyltransferase family protein n=1 Tax=Pseudomonas chlororaphis TaxID=587753 RepID=UPI000F57F51A|nr:acyltransferase [Pseudomonas chlororaphis]AZD53924.1 Acetyltransferase [Pseudomonas chlororaphis subsp. aurantiaca]